MDNTDDEEKKAKYQATIDQLTNSIAQNNALAKAQTAPIERLGALLKKKSAIALTIESTVQKAEFAIRLADATAELAKLDSEDKGYQAEITRFSIFADMGNADAANNIVRI